MVGYAIYWFDVVTAMIVKRIQITGTCLVQRTLDIIVNRATMDKEQCIYSTHKMYTRPRLVTTTLMSTASKKKKRD